MPAHRFATSSASGHAHAEGRGPGSGHGAGRISRLAARALAALRAGVGGGCALCRSWCRNGLCSACEGLFAPVLPRCLRCAEPLASGDGPLPVCRGCRVRPCAWSELRAGVDYGPPFDRLLAALKFHGGLSAIEALLTPLEHAIAGPVPARGLRIVPVPLTDVRLRERGYNQAWELARRLASRLDLPARADALFRVRDTGHQLALPRVERARNLRGAFVVSPHSAAWVRGARVALVDDVLTTGATAEAACRCLRAAGAIDVRVWVAARTPAARAQASR